MPPWVRSTLMFAWMVLRAPIAVVAAMIVLAARVVLAGLEFWATGGTGEWRNPRR